MKGGIVLLAAVTAVGAFSPARPRSSLATPRSAAHRGAAAPSAEGEPSLEELKTTLLAAVAARRGDAAARKGAILSAARALERRGVRSAGVDGRWSLVYSTMSREAEPTAGGSGGGVLGAAGLLAELPQKLTDVIYKTLFRFLPALAGGQESDGGGGPSVRNEQLVDLRQGVVDNQVGGRRLG